MGHRISAFVAALTLSLALGLAVAPVAADPIHDAAKAGDVSKVKALLARGVKVDARKEDGWTPLHKAVLIGRADLVEALLSAGANPKAKGVAGNTPFGMAKDLGTLKGTDAYWLLNDAQYD